MKDKRINFFVYISLFFCLSAIFFTSLLVNVYNKNFYYHQINKLNIVETSGITKNDLHKMSDTLLDYLQHKKNSIDVLVTVGDKKRLAFTNNEVIHMQDVRNLFDYIGIFIYVAALIGVIFLIYLVYKKKKIFFEISIGFIKVAFVFLILMVSIIGIAYFNFDEFWINFHKLLFRNDLWLLPDSSLMIQLLPESLFNALVLKIGITILIIFLILVVLNIGYITFKMRGEYDEKINIS